MWQNERFAFTRGRVVVGAAVLMLIAGPLWVGAAGGPEQSGGDSPAKLVVWMPSYIDAAVEFMRESAAARFPGHEIEITPYPMGEYDVKMTAALAARSSTPDVLISHAPFVPKLIAAGTVDLTELVSPIRDQLIPSSLGPAMTADGRVYGLPFEITHTVFMYRQDIYDDLGLEPPSTIDEMIDMGTVLRREGKYATAADLLNGDSNLFENLLLKLGGNYFSTDGNLILGTPEGKGVEAARLYKQLVDAGVVWDGEFNSPGWWDAFTSGEVASFMFLNWYPKRLRVSVNDSSVPGFGQWRLTYGPVIGPEYPKVSLFGNVTTMINGRSENQDLAWEYVQFLTLEPEGSMPLMDEFAILSGSIPNLTSLAKGGSISWPLFGGQEISSLEAGILLEAENYINFHIAFNETQSIIRDELAGMIAGETTPEQAIASAEERIRDALRKY